MSIINAIDIKNLTKYYGKNIGISNLTLSIEQGEIFGFIGPNGAGKSTTIRTLLNFIFPTSGSAEIFGKDIVADSTQIKNIVGYLPSEINYYSDMKTGELLRYSAAFYKKDCSNRIRELSQMLELELDKRIEDLSLGNRKKVAIIQALLHGPRLLILDEPTSGLDPLMQKIFYELLTEEKKKGTTIFFSSHILAEVQRMCNRVAIIKNGQLVKVETIDNLVGNKFKKVTIYFEGEKTPDIKIEGAVKQETDKNTIRILYNGDMKKMIKQISNIEFKDISIEEPSLEELFMNYYE